MNPRITFLACLPRSRSAWCANLLTHGPSFAYHEPLRWATKEGVPDWLGLAKVAGVEYVTFCDTAFGLYWKQALETAPNARVLILWQGPELCRRSWNKAVALSGQPSLHDADGNGLYRMERELRQLVALGAPKLRQMRVRALDRISGALALWEFCTGGRSPFAPKFDARRARMLLDMDIQAILPRYIDDSGETPRVRMIGDRGPLSPALCPDVGEGELATMKGLPCPSAA